MILAFLLGAIAGAGVGFVFYLRARRAAGQAAEERQLVQQEKQIVVDFMHDMVEALGENLNRTELLQRIVHAAILSTGALSACYFERTSQGTMRGVAVEGLFPPHRPLPDSLRQKATTRARFLEQILRSEEFPIDEGIVGLVARTAKPMMIADAAADPRIVTHDDPALVVRSLIAAPVVFRDEFCGVLCVVNPADNLPFTENDFSLVQSLAEQAGMAIHNQSLLRFQLQKRQLDLDLALASGIQQMLLPHAAPEVAGIEIDARYQAALQVGGDLYDLIPLAGGRLAVAVADVSGKGIAASLLMAICRTNLRQIAPRHHSPAAILSELNAAMAGEIQPGMFITVACAIFDPVRGEVVVARAGHEKPLLVRAGGAAVPEFVASEGMPLGLVSPEVFEPALENRLLSWNPGDLVVLYTDGVTESPNEEGREFSGARLGDVARNLAGAPVRAINDGILEAVRRFTGRDHPHDDLTLVTVKRA